MYRYIQKNLYNPIIQNSSFCVNSLFSGKQFDSKPLRNTNCRPNTTLCHISAKHCPQSMIVNTD
ncbi:MAG: hypothetical protein LBI18_05030 [Planctomycetaceae bacterium]|nr:hypothetical protein [Planctomycetaceae bacterium]